jgi:hypothetical protein
MADNVSLYGFRFIRQVSGRDSYSQIERSVADAYQAAPGAVNVDLNIGDPIKQLADGTVALAVANEEILGFFNGCLYFDGTKMRYGNKLPGGTTGGGNRERLSKVFLIPSAHNVFEVDCDDAVTATTEALYEALIGENADLSINADSTTKQARPLLDVSDRKTATAQFRIVGISKTVQNRDFSGARVKLEVVVNESSHKDGSDPSADGV